MAMRVWENATTANIWHISANIALCANMRICALTRTGKKWRMAIPCQDGMKQNDAY